MQVGRGTRWPQIGDLLTEKVNGREYVGLVYKITPDDSVFIIWSGKTPHGYYKEYGYSATNIHNQYHKFSLVKTCK